MVGRQQFSMLNVPVKGVSNLRHHNFANVGDVYYICTWPGLLNEVNFVFICCYTGSVVTAITYFVFYTHWITGFFWAFVKSLRTKRALVNPKFGINHEELAFDQSQSCLAVLPRRVAIGMAKERDLLSNVSCTTPDRNYSDRKAGIKN